VSEEFFTSSELANQGAKIILYSRNPKKPAQKEHGENVDKIKWQNLSQA